jgi:hypothetical protein
MQLATTSAAAAVPRGILSTCLQFIFDMLRSQE